MPHRQKTETTRVFQSLLKPIGFVLLLAFGLMLYADRFLHNALNMTILNDARSNAETWSQKVSQRHPELAQIEGGRVLTQETVGEIMQSAALNNVFRFKLFDPSGQLLFVSDEPVFNSESTEAGVVDVVGQVFLTGETDTSLHNGEEKPNRPDVYAESYIKALLPNGSPYGVIEVYVDVSELSSSFHNVFHTISRTLIFGSAVAYLIPALFFIARREKVRAQSKKILHLTKVDPLTGLLNRRALADQIKPIFNHTGDEKPGVIFIDMDYFKQMNDGLGHEFGDAVLKHVSNVLADTKSNKDVLSRYGGDEFILVTNCKSKEELYHYSLKVSRSLNDSFTFKGSTITVEASLGVHWAANGETPEQAIHKADLALQHSKRNDRGTATLFTPELDQELQKRRYVEATLRRAQAGHGAFHMEFQPIFSVLKEGPAGYEALMRLTDEVGNPISPTEFIPIAEEAGAMAELGALALQYAISVASRWPSDRFLTVNLSVAQFENGDLIEIVKSALYKFDFAASRLHLEITESLLIESKEQVAWQLDALQELGVSISLDDFGTGYSGLGYLLQFQFDTLKIDRMFLPDLEDPSGKQQHLISAAIELGKKLGMNVVVEGVETKEQLAFLVEHGCSYVQGFLLGRPITKEALAEQEEEAGKAATVA